MDSWKIHLKFQDSIDNLHLLNHSINAVAEIRSNPILNQQPTNGRMPPQNWQCYICKKKFSGNSIKEHEKQCMKQWHMENERQGSVASPPLKKGDAWKLKNHYNLSLIKLIRRPVLTV